MKKLEDSSEVLLTDTPKDGVVDFAMPMQDFIAKVKYVKDNQISGLESKYVDHSVRLDVVSNT